MINKSASQKITLWLCTVLFAAMSTTTLGEQVSETGSLRNKTAPDHPSLQQLQQQREHYLAAQDALHKRRLKSYRQNRQQLFDYPLTPYLDYAELRRRLHRLPHQDVDQFFGKNKSSLLGERLRKQWLTTLAKQKRWQDYRSYYTEAADSTELQCYSLESRVRTGDKTALTEVAELWNVGRSQPDECNSIFKLWLNSEHFNQDIAWQRFDKAMAAGKAQLAAYIAKRFETDNRRYANLYTEVHHYPARLHKQQRFLEQSPKMQSVILHGIKRYARRDAPKALRQWQKYDAQQLFDEQQRFEAQQYLASRLVRQGHQDKAEELLAGMSDITSDRLLEGLLREFLKEKDWIKTLTYIQKLPAEAQQSNRWQYWLARAMEQSGSASEKFTPQHIYTNLALQRDYYGFLAADRLGRQYQLGDAPTLLDQSKVTAIASRPASQRARELLAVGDDLNARREWLFMTQQLTTEEHVAAAKLAHQWGWHHNTIISLASAKHWDDLQMRFPLAYNKQVQQTARQLNVSPLLLFAIARQESAFAADARSPAGAMGLMQLLPSTAKMTAKRAGIRYRKFDLLTPEKNIVLGSHYINSLLKQFNGNRILAAAAYNAGPHRVKQWLKSSAEQLPYDIWIETIPYRETRKYVQNILAYSVIYGYRMGTTPSLLSPTEANQSL
jgi:soluble lytic murein transglycosylase